MPLKRSTSDSFYALIDNLIREGARYRRIALKMYKIMADEGDAVSMHRVGFYALTGTIDGINENDPLGHVQRRWKVDLESAKHYLLKAFSAGYKEAAYDLAWLYYFSVHKKKESPARLHYWGIKACRHAIGIQKYHAYYMLGWYWYHFGRSYDRLERAHACWRKSARGGCASGMMEMAIAYGYGEGVRKNKSLALKYFRRCVEAEPDSGKDVLVHIRRLGWESDLQLCKLES